MLTEAGYDAALNLMQFPREQKEVFSVKSYEVQKEINKIVKGVRPINYDPIQKNVDIKPVTREMLIRQRGFRQAVIEAYKFRCAVCGLKIKSPNKHIWEVEAAHIVPHSAKGKDDILNGLSLCRLHHWAFDVGWFSILDDYTIEASPEWNDLSDGFGKLGHYEIIKALATPSKIFLPDSDYIYPHRNALQWHRKNIFNKV